MGVLIVIIKYFGRFPNSLNIIKDFVVLGVFFFFLVMSFRNQEAHVFNLVTEIRANKVWSSYFSHTKFFFFFFLIFNPLMPTITFGIVKIKRKSSINYRLISKKIKKIQYHKFILKKQTSINYSFTYKKNLVSIIGLSKKTPVSVIGLLKKNKI